MGEKLETRSRSSSWRITDWASVEAPPGTGATASAARLAPMGMKKAQKIQRARAARAEVAMLRNRTEQRMEAASQNPMYTMLTKKYTKRRPTSPQPGTTPT